MSLGKLPCREIQQRYFDFDLESLARSPEHKTEYLYETMSRHVNLEGPRC